MRPTRRGRDRRSVALSHDMNNLCARTVVALVSALAVACARAPGAVGELTRCEEGSWSAPFPLHRGDGRPVYVERGIVTAFGSGTLALGTPTFLWLRQNHMLPGPGADRAEAPPADANEALWLTYYASIFNPARLKLTMMRKEMPRRSWKRMWLLWYRLLLGKRARKLIDNAGFL